MLPSEILSVIFGHFTVPDVSPLFSINKRMKELVLGSVIELCGDCTIRDLRIFPHLRSVSGMVHIDTVQDIQETMERCPNVGVHLNCECTASEVLLYPCIQGTSKFISVGTVSELKSLIKRDFIHVRLTLPYQWEFYPGNLGTRMRLLCEDIYAIIVGARLKTMKIKIANIHRYDSLPPIYVPYVMTMFNLNNGILYLKENEYCDRIVRIIRHTSGLPTRISAIYRYGSLYLIQYSDTDTLDDIISHTLLKNVYCYCFYYPWKNRRINVIRRIRDGKYYFFPERAQVNDKIVSFAIPVDPKQIPNLLHVFPRIKSITIVPTNIEISFDPSSPTREILREDRHETKKELRELRTRYPKIRFYSF